MLIRGNINTMHEASVSWLLNSFIHFVIKLCGELWSPIWWYYISESNKKISANTSGGLKALLAKLLFKAENENRQVLWNKEEDLHLEAREVTTHCP